MMALSPLLMAPFGWRGLWLANAVLVVLFAAALNWTTRAFAARPAGRGVASSIARDIWDTLAAPGPPVLALTFATYTLQYLAVVGFLPTILVEREGLSQPVAAVLTAIVIAANVPGNLIGGVLLHRGARRWALVACASVAMALCGLGIYPTDLPLWFRYGLCVVFSLVCGILPASVLGAAPVLAPRPQLVATTNGLIMQGSNLGQSIGPPAVAALAVRVGDWHLSPIVLIAAAALGVALAFVLRMLERRVAPR
jgi:cyanate permease